MKIKACQMCDKPTTKKLCMNCSAFTSTLAEVVRTNPGEALDAIYFLADQVGFDLDALIKEEAMI